VRITRQPWHIGSNDIVPAEESGLNRRYKPSVYTRVPWEFQSQAVVSWKDEEMEKCEDYKGIVAKYYVPARGQGRGDTLEGTGAVLGRFPFQWDESYFSRALLYLCLASFLSEFL
jgi:hypothetical protein